MKSKASEYTYVIPLIVMGMLCFYFSLTLEWYGDPIDYKFLEPSATDYDAIPERYVENLTDICISQYNHYFVTNGRYVVHFIVQIFCGLVGQAWFAVFNALVWVCLIYFTLKFAVKGRFTVRNTIAASLLFFILLLPVRFDPPFQINYAWSALFMIIWIDLFMSRRRYSPLVLMLTGIFSFLFGECNEGFSIPLCFAVAAYTVYNKFRLTPLQWVCAVSMGLGSIILVASPGSWNRLHDVSEAGAAFGINELIGILPGLIIPAIFFIVAWCRRKVLKPELNPETLFFAVFIVVNFSLGIITGYGFGSRMLVPGNVVFIVLILKALDKRSLSNAVNITGIALCVAAAMVFGVYSERLNKTERAIYAEFMASDDGVVYLPDSAFVGHMFRILSFGKEYRIEGKALCPAKPEMRIRPEVMRQYAEAADTNVIVKVGPQAWFLVQSASYPARFVLERRILPGILDIRMADRELDFDMRWEVAFEQNSRLKFALYRNTKPFFVESAVRMENPMTE